MEGKNSRYKLSSEEINRELSNYTDFRMGIDWAGAGKHKTCVSVLGWDSKTNTWHEILRFREQLKSIHELRH